MISESATEFDRLREAYIAMSKRAKYRPAAPIDGCGNITLSDEVLADPQQLGKEAAHYATEFINEGYRFWIGVSDFSTNRALVYTIESARNLCGGLGSIDTAIRLLEMALAEAKQAKRDYEGERCPPIHRLRKSRRCTTYNVVIDLSHNNGNVDLTSAQKDGIGAKLRQLASVWLNSGIMHYFRESFAKEPSFRIFFRARFRAKACFTRRRSPGFR